MKIFIPFDYFKGIGGPTTFMINFKKVLDDNNFNYLEKWEKGCMIFFPIQYDLSVLFYLKKTGGKVIQRLDGVYYPSKNGKAYKKMNYQFKVIYLKYSDFIVFQSQYSLKQCFTMLGGIPDCRYKIIYNGVDKSIFSPSNKKVSLQDPIIFITTGNFRNVDMLEPIVKALDLLEKEFNFKLLVVGPITNQDLVPLINRTYIEYVGSLSLKGVAELLRNSDIFLYSHLNPPCPNSVIEAISCGSPVVGFNSGAMSELLYFSSELLVPVNNKIFHRYKDFNFSLLKEKILYLIKNYNYYKLKALEFSYLYDMEYTAKQYLEVFHNVYNDTFPLREIPFEEKIRFYIIGIKEAIFKLKKYWFFKKIYILYKVVVRIIKILLVRLY